MERRKAVRRPIELPIEVSGDWSKHEEAVRPEILEFDRQNTESMARAPFIVVSNETGRRKRLTKVRK